MTEFSLSLITGVASVVAALAALVAAAMLLAGAAATRDAVRREADSLRGQLAVLDQGLRREIAASVQGGQAAQAEALDRVARGLRDAVELALRNFGEQQNSRLAGVDKTVNDGSANVQAVLGAFKIQVGDAGEAQRLAMDATMKGFADRLADLRQSLAQEQEMLRTMVAERLDRMQAGNEAKLEEMRKAVDEKLQTALEKQLRDSFTNLQEQLASVQQAIGQVQSVAGEVGDLKRLFSNVKSRGGWGEAQLEAMLADIMPAGTFEKNFRVKESSTEAVEFALRVPGRGDEPVWLAIDSKFPTEDYARLVAANEAGNRDDEARARVALERAVRVQARKIADKYIEAPRTLDFAILYLPSDSLFAEIARAPGLIEALRQEHRVMLTGPSLLPAFLHTFRVGYASMQLERQATEIGETLGAVKVEWGKFGDSLTKIQNQAEKLSTGIGETLRRQRAVGRKLRGVTQLDDNRAALVLGLDVTLEETGEEE
jgi:DNA recombination protein RmuC